MFLHCLVSEAWPTLVLSYLRGCLGGIGKVREIIYLDGPVFLGG